MRYATKSVMRPAGLALTELARGSNRAERAVGAKDDQGFSERHPQRQRWHCRTSAGRDKSGPDLHQKGARVASRPAGGGLRGRLPYWPGDKPAFDDRPGRQRCRADRVLALCERGLRPTPGPLGDYPWRPGPIAQRGRPPRQAGVPCRWWRGQAGGSSPEPLRL